MKDNRFKIIILIPTYNEKDNISLIIEKIFEKDYKHDVNVLVIDDNSPDGTGQIVKDLISQKYNNRLFILERQQKNGLAKAYIAGFKWSLERKYDVILEMDADLSHNPKYLPSMFEAAENYDFAVGSRYVQGGGVSGWGLLRKIISRGGSLYSRIILNIPIKDLTGGFNLWHSHVLEKMNIDSIISDGYSFQIELKYRALKSGFKGKEVPILFEDRTLGKSKMSKKIVLEALLKVWQLKFKF